MYTLFTSHKNLISQLHHCYYQATLNLSKEEKRTYSTHFHGYYEVLLLVQGNIDVIIEGAKYNLSANELIIIPPNTFHYIIPDQNIYQRIIFHFSLNEKLCELNSKKYYFRPNSNSFNILPSFISKFIYYQTNLSNADFGLIAESLTSELIIWICNTTSEPYLKKISHNPLIQQILLYIEEHIYEQVTLKDLSQHFHFTENYISILFKKAMHIPIATYIKNKKMDAIHSALEKGIPAVQVAADYGFTSYSTFFRLYKKTFNELPSKTIKTGKKLI